MRKMTLITFLTDGLQRKLMLTLMTLITVVMGVFGTSGKWRQKG